MSFTTKQFFKITKNASSKVASHFNLSVNDVFAIMTEAYCEHEEDEEIVQVLPAVRPPPVKVVKAKGTRVRSAYFLFYDVEKLKYPGTNATVLTAQISVAWKSLTADEKKVYLDKHEALKLGGVVGGAVKAVAKKRIVKRKNAEALETKALVADLVIQNDAREAELQERLDNYTVMSQHRDPAKKKRCVDKLANEVQQLKEQKQKTLAAVINDPEDDLLLFSSDDENDVVYMNDQQMNFMQF